MRDATIEEIDRLVGSATPHFAYQLRARVDELIKELPTDNPTRRYGEEKMELLDRLGHASSRAEEGPREPRTRPGWEEIPSSAPASEPLPPRRIAYMPHAAPRSRRPHRTGSTSSRCRGKWFRFPSPGT